jgi:hypothetical protein
LGSPPQHFQSVTPPNPAQSANFGYHPNPTGGGSGRDGGAAVARAAADWLSLTAAPTFAVMAFITAMGGQPQWLCAATHLGAPLSGMVPMYLLMSPFHTAPWLRLISARRI